MIEIAHIYLSKYNNNSYLDRYSKINTVRSLHLAEGPGGFIEALVNKRKNKLDK